MSLHVIVGAGQVGSTTATLLAEQGERVRLVSRRGSGPTHPAIERVAADATDAERLSALADGAAALYNCANPLYHRWLTDWPPLASSLLTAAERSGAVLVSASNLYGYGPVDGPITPETPLAATQPKLRLRAQMWRDALAAHQAGRLRTAEVRASDYIEANSIFSFTLTKPLLAGRRAYVPAELDVPHSWTSTVDVARTLVTVATDERAWGRAGSSRRCCASCGSPATSGTGRSSSTRRSPSAPSGWLRSNWTRPWRRWPRGRLSGRRRDGPGRRRGDGPCRRRRSTAGRPPRSS